MGSYILGDLVRPATASTSVLAAGCIRGRGESGIFYREISWEAFRHTPRPGNRSMRMPTHPQSGSVSTHSSFATPRQVRRGGLALAWVNPFNLVVFYVNCSHNSGMANSNVCRTRYSIAHANSSAVLTFSTTVRLPTANMSRMQDMHASTTCFLDAPSAAWKAVLAAYKEATTA